MNSLLGVELPTPVTFVIAFVVVLALIGAAAWLVRRFGAARLAAGRGRQPRLAVIDAASIDGRRKLIIIRRDNVEHLLMIGGPTDVVVESNIVRAGAANQREVPAPRSAETLPRPATLPEAPTGPQAEPAIAPRPERPRLVAEAPAPMAMAPQPTLPAAPPSAAGRAGAEPPRPPTAADPLLGLAAELSRSKPETAPRPPEPPRLPLTTAQGSGAPANPAVTPIPPPASKPTVVPITPAAPASATPPSTKQLTPDARLAEMAQQLENALRRPLAATAVGREDGTPAAETKLPEPNTVQFPEAKPAPPPSGPAQAKSGNGAPTRSVYEDLEQEMASLLGRQSGKS